MSVFSCLFHWYPDVLFQPADVRFQLQELAKKTFSVNSSLSLSKDFYQTPASLSINKCVVTVKLSQTPC